MKTTSKLQKPQTQTHFIVEPGVRSLFRHFIGFQWALMVLALCGLNDNTDVGAPVNVVLTIAYSTVLFLYLRSNRLHRWLGHVYLPLAISVATFAPIFISALSVNARLEANLMGEASVRDPGALILWLVAPLVAVAAQYGFIAVLIFCGVTTGIEYYFANELASIGSVPLSFYGEQTVIRNLIFLAVGFIIARLIGEQRRQRKALREANEQLAQFAVTLEQLAVSRERNRMARDLHDTLAHTLSAVSIQLEAVTTIWDSSPDTARDRIQTIQGITRDGLRETRHALQALRSSPLEDLGLRLSLHMDALKAAERAGFRPHVSIPETLPELSTETELSLYRVVEEALNNIVQHAQATDVWLRLDVTGQAITLSIRDNGIGFDSDAPSPEGHFGLVGMFERAALCDGEIAIVSDPHAGTKITLKIRR
ncbi:MAG: sensor histidine kinase [Anaerolineae bacterium]